MSLSSQIAVGLDIGYSLCKVVFGPPDLEPTSVTFPIGTGLIEDAYIDPFPAGEKPEDTILMSGKQWVAGHPPTSISHFVREMSEQYPYSQQYTALLRASLLLVGARKIDCMVTGLSTASMAANCISLRDRLRGSHVINERVAVAIEEVYVQAQPFGTFAAIQARADGIPGEDVHTLVVDPGFYSVDWVVLRGLKVIKHSSSSSDQALSRVLDEATRLLGGRPGPQRIEERMQTGQYIYNTATRSIDLRVAIKEAAQEIARRATRQMIGTLRGERKVHQVWITGGGADIFAPAICAGIRDTYGAIPVEVVDNPVTANARGFWELAASRLPSQAR